MRALVVGHGRMGGFHARVLRDLGLDVTTVDPDPVVGADYQRVPSRNFEVACIAAPIGWLVDEAACWVAHEGWLLVEKPFAETLERAVMLAAAFEGQRVAVGYVERFNPQVRVLRSMLAEHDPSLVTFQRWNTRRSPDARLDLAAHDIDLAAFLGVACPVRFDARSDAPRHVRRVDVDGRVAVDLMAHETSPLHAQWHAFLSDRAGFATPADAIHVHETLATTACT